MSQVHIQDIEPGDAEAFDQAFAIYHEAIERSEQRPEASLRASFAREDYLFLTATLDDAVVGMSVAWLPPGETFWVFEYVAVAAEMRGRGVGAQLFAVNAMLAGERVGLVEVDAGASEIEVRRRGFYGRLGCRVLRGLDYILPLDAFGTPPAMRLMATATGASVKREVVASWLRAIYSRVYARPLSDPRLARMIDPLPDEVTLDPA